MAFSRIASFSVWLRGTEVAIAGYVEPADRSVGIMGESLVIEALAPVQPDPLWREPDLDDLLDSGEYLAIERAWFDTEVRYGDDYQYRIFSYAQDEWFSDSEWQHAEWRAWWLT